LTDKTETLDKRTYQDMREHWSSAPRYVFAAGRAWRACLAGRDVGQNEALRSFFRLRVLK
jgi:hypothetical protein